MLTTITGVLSIAGALWKCKPCLGAIAAIVLLLGGGLYGVSVERARSEAKIERMKIAAKQAAEERDRDVKADLERTFQPQLEQLVASNKSLKDKVKQYENRKPATARPVCRLGDAAGVLQPAPAREPAGAARGRLADYLRRHPRAGAGAGSKAGG